MEARIAYVPETRIWAHDSSGNPIVGATLTIYDAGTTNLSSVYRDAALATPMTNPTSGADAADSGGWFPQIFAAEGGLFDIAIKTSAGVAVKSYVSVPAVGEGGGDITRDFGTARVWIGNRGGVIRFEGGNAEGDDIGGDVSIGGWNATQADTLELDAAATNTTGTLTVKSHKLPGIVTGEYVFSGVGSVVLDIPNDPAGVTAYEIHLMYIAGSAGGTLGATVSYDNGATYRSTAYVTWAGGSAVLDTTQFTLSAATGSITVDPASGVYTLITDNSTGISPIFGLTSQNGANQLLTGISGHHAMTGATRITNLKLVASAGTMSGRARVVPLYGTGDI